MKPYYENENGVLYNGDCLSVLKKLPDQLINCCVTSPPYFGLRDYGNKKQLGLESGPGEYVKNIVKVFRELKRVLADDGTLWLNLGDTYAGSQTAGNKKFGNEKFNKNRPSREKSVTPKKTRPKNLQPKDLIGIPWRVAFALQDDGWCLRQDIIWSKPNPMPESVTDRCTKSHEYIFLLSKSKKYFYDYEKIREPAAYDGRKDCLLKGSPKYKTSVVPGQAEHTIAARGHQRWIFKDGKAVKNKRSVWTVPTKPYKGAHFAAFNYELITPCILAGCPEGGIVCDPFFGSGTTGLAAYNLDRRFIGIELNKDYCEIATKRIKKETRQLKLF